MRIIEKAQQFEILDFLMNDQIIMFGYTPPMLELEKIEIYQLNNFDFVQFFVLIDPFLLKEYNLFS